jgi:hypothetical protein
MNAPTQLAELKNPSPPLDVKVDFFSKNGFELACRIAKAFSTSDAVPAQFRQFVEKKERGGGVVLVENPAALGNCLVAFEVSRTIGMSTVAVMQNADVIQGKLRWSSKFQIAAINASKRFSPLKFKLTNLGRIKAKYKEKLDWNKQLNRYNFAEHEVEIDNWECVAWAYELDASGRQTAEIVQSIPVTMQMAVEEGWYSKEGSKWQGSMRFQMLQYRAGTFFGSIYAPDVLMGMGKSAEEERDAIDVTPQADGSFAVTSTLQELRSSPDVGSIPPSGEAPDTDTREITSGAGAPVEGPTFEKIAERLKNATDVDVLDADADFIREIADPQQQAELQAMYRARREALTAQPAEATQQQTNTRPRRERGAMGME